MQYLYMPLGLKHFSGAVQVPESSASTRGKTKIVGTTAFSHSRLPEDPTGNFNLTLRNLVVGSRWSIEETSGFQRDMGVAEVSTITIPLSVYADANRNELVIKVGKASEAPYYRRYETRVTGVIGQAQSIFVNQERDDI